MSTDPDVLGDDSLLDPFDGLPHYRVTAARVWAEGEIGNPDLVCARFDTAQAHITVEVPYAELVGIVDAAREWRSMTDGWAADLELEDVTDQAGHPDPGNCCATAAGARGTWMRLRKSCRVCAIKAGDKPSGVQEELIASWLEHLAANDFIQWSAVHRNCPAATRRFDKAR